MFSSKLETPLQWMRRVFIINEKYDGDKQSLCIALNFNFHYMLCIVVIHIGVKSGCVLSTMHMKTYVINYIQYIDNIYINA